MILLQLDPDIVPELNTTVQQLSKSSIELSQALADFGALKVIAGVFLVIVLLMTVIFFYQVISTSSKVRRIDQSTQKVEKFFGEAAEKTIGRAQAQILIRRAFNSLAQTIKYNIIRIRLENHIENEEAIKSKVTSVVGYEYANLESFFSNFNTHDKALSDVVSPDDAKIVSDFILEQVYISKDQFTISGMDQATDILLNGIKLEYLQKL